MQPFLWRLVVSGTCTAIKYVLVLYTTFLFVDAQELEARGLRNMLWYSQHIYLSIHSFAGYLWDKPIYERYKKKSKDGSENGKRCFAFGCSKREDHDEIINDILVLRMSDLDKNNMNGKYSYL